MFQELKSFDQDAFHAHDILQFKPKSSNATPDSCMLFNSDYINSREVNIQSSPQDKIKAEKEKEEELFHSGIYNVSNDPYAALLKKSVKIRQRVHNANEITTKLRALSHHITRPSVNNYLFPNNNNNESNIKQICETLYSQFEMEFAGALREMRGMYFFGVLTPQEKLALPIARTAFLSSRRNLVGMHKSQHLLLSRQLISAFQRHCRLRQDIIRLQPDLQLSNNNNNNNIININSRREISQSVSSFSSIQASTEVHYIMSNDSSNSSMNTHKRISSSLSNKSNKNNNKHNNNNIIIIIENSVMEGCDRTGALHVLLRELQNIITQQQERLHELELQAKETLLLLKNKNRSK